MDFSLITNTGTPQQIENISIFPNPSTGNINVNAQVRQMQDVQIEIYNLLGQPIYNQSINKVSQLQETIDISGFPNGYYLLIVRLEDGSFHSEQILKTN